VEHKILLVSREAGGITADVEATIAAAFLDHKRLDFDPDEDLRASIHDDTTVIVAGGDGTIGCVARALAGTPATLGLLSLGTNNNFARALGLPEDLDEAIAVIKNGKPRPVSLGMIDDHHFLETASIGLFGEAIDLGESLKDHVVKGLPARVRAVVAARPFEYSISGDIEAHGRARSLVFSNTPTTGTQMPVGDSNPTTKKLDLAVQVGASRSDIVGRMLGSVFLDKHVDHEGMTLRFTKISITTTPILKVNADNAFVAQTPVTISVHTDAIRVIQPA
jgi:diacylglycerol kinase family enzyme